MTLLDDARRLVETDPQPVNGLSRCHWCDEFTSTEPHAPDCPWLSVPRILAVLEAAERLIETQKKHGQSGFCWGCGKGISREMLGIRPAHTKDCPWQALKAALSGEEATT